MGLSGIAALRDPEVVSRALHAQWIEYEGPHHLVVGRAEFHPGVSNVTANESGRGSHRV